MMKYKANPDVQDIDTFFRRYSEEFALDIYKPNAASEPDEFQQALEAADAFSEDPIGFEDIAGTLWTNARSLYQQTKVYNRYSAAYQMSCEMLERLIKKMASLCITRTVLEQSGMEFPSLGDCSISELYGMVSFHFRKSAAAFEGLKTKKQLLDPDLLAWQYRWFSMTERLKATEEKIQNIHDGKIKVESLLKRSRLFESESRSAHPAVKNAPKQLEAPKESAFPILGSYARIMLREHKNEEREEAKLDKLAIPPMPAIIYSNDPKLVSNGYADTFTETPERQELRELFVQAGGDPDDVRFVPDQDIQYHIELKKRFLARLAKSPPRSDQPVPYDQSDERLRQLRNYLEKLDAFSPL